MLAIAIVLAGLIIGAALFTSSYLAPTTKTVTRTSTLTAPGSALSTGGAARVYEVTFRQTGACSPSLFVGPWSVTLGGQTLTKPSNVTLPVQSTASPLNPNDTITFSVPDGTYEYAVSPGVYFQPSSGVVNVDGSDVTVALQGPVTSCPTSMLTPTRATNTSVGLSLRLSLNASSMTSGGSLQSVVSEFNVLPETNNVSRGAVRLSWGLMIDDSYCRGQDMPFGIAVFQGHYGLTSLTDASPLTLFNPGVTYTCTSHLSPAYYVFQPLSDTASIMVYSDDSVVNEGSQPVAFVVTIQSYWDSSGVQHNYGPGVYTIAAADEWGQLTLAYFTVT